MIKMSTFEDLQEHWRRRHALSTKEMESLYGLVYEALRDATIFDGLEREDVFHDFFIDKVLHSRAESVPYSPRALYTYFKRYQLSELKARAIRPLHMSVGEVDENHAAAATVACSIDQALFHEARAAEVNTFFEKLGEQEKTLLQHAHCGDRKLSDVKREHRVASAYHHARQLGLILNPNKLPANWKNTKLGRLVTTVLGIPLDAREDLFQVFEMLCFAAAAWWKERTCAA